MADAIRRELLTRIHPFLQNLSRELNEPVDLSMPAQRFHGREEDLAAALIAACTQIREELGVE